MVKQAVVRFLSTVDVKTLHSSIVWFRYETTTLLFFNSCNFPLYAVTGSYVYFSAVIIFQTFPADVIYGQPLDIT